MHRLAPRFALAAALTLALVPGLSRAEETALSLSLDLETGVAVAGRNDVRVPGDGGTTFSLSGGAFQTDASPFVRMSAGASYGRHRLLATFAPLRLSGGGREGDPIQFRGLTFTPGSARANYRLDTYRLTYRYALVAWPRLDLEVGATALLRDTEIRLSQPGQSTAETSLGVIPLFSFRLAWRFGGGPLGIVLDGDALPVTQGRTEDVSLALEYKVGDLAFRAGYRLLEGATSTSKLYNVALVNHVLVGARYAF